MQPPQPPDDVPIDFGVAGASALAEHERRHKNREERALARGRVRGRITLALTDDPQSTKAWEQGASGERFVGAHLDKLRSKGICVLHDRHIPSTRANIDHIVVAPSGIWVVDTKNYSGAIEVRDIGGWFRTDLRLYVGNRDRTKLVAGMAKQLDAVRHALGANAAPVRAVLCFSRDDWKPFAKPLVINGVVVSRVQQLTKLIQRAENRGVSVSDASALLARTLRPAV
jgi:hypothetical protein